MSKVKGQFGVSDATSDVINNLGLYNHSNNRPLNNKLIIFIDTVSVPKTKGGIFIPEEARRAQAYAKTTGIVLELGPNAFKDAPKSIKVWDRVSFRSYSGIDVQEFHEELDCSLFYRILEDKEIHALYEIIKPNK